MQFPVRAVRALETGRLDGVVTRAIGAALEPLLARSLVRPARIPPSVGVVCVGGATMGGSGKTRVALACARALAAAGARVVVVGHGYRAASGEARFVSPSDDLALVGDEALALARAFASAPRARGRSRVVIARTRQQAIDLAVTSADVLVLDGPLRLREMPPRALALLAVDADAPWGSGQPVPAGDLRAPPSALEALADHVVPVPAAVAAVSGRFGLFTALARPDRLVRAFAAAGTPPAVVVSVADHGPLDARVRSRLERAQVEGRVEMWVATEKCALHLEARRGRDESLAVRTIADRLILPLSVTNALESLGCLDRAERWAIVSREDS